MQRIRTGTNSLFLLAITVALGFGATQAAAAPDSAEAQGCTRIFYGSTCASGVAGVCNSYCQSLGFAGSRCSDDPYRPRSCCTCQN